jgi:hypothetical protein
MALNRMSALWARTALLWFAIAVSLGLYMGVTQQFQFTPAHAHVGVLGWLSSGVFAFLHSISRPWPEGARAPVLHWAAHTLGVAIMTLGLFVAIGLQKQALMPVVEIGATLTVLAVFWAVMLFWPRLRAG